MYWKKPEVMSPAGYWPQLQAAVEAGADAVYFGLRHFTARAKVGFGVGELEEVMRTLHKRGVKGYVTFNTLVFDHELEAAARALGEIAEAGADAIIVQDLAVVKLARRIVPDLAVHGSTQMSITSAEGVELARRIGVSRVVLARELSLKDVRVIRGQTDCELEMFVHGALCVSYSGQCFSSEAWGGRSANRGQCAQACRLPYEMVVDGKRQPLADARYLLSPGDLNTLDQVPEIAQIGISALKIEGRYKDADYVALTTAAYRKAVDGAEVSREEKLQLEQVYSRGSGAYFVTGTNHQEVVRGRAPRHRGVKMGTVVKVMGQAVLVEVSAAGLKSGDGVVFDAADWRSPQEREEGGHVFGVLAKGPGKVELTFGNGVVDFGRIRSGDWVWRTHDVDVDKAARVYTAGEVVRRQKVMVRVSAHEGAPLVADWRLLERPGVCVTVVSEVELGKARERGVSREYLIEQFGRLGSVAYELADVELETSGKPFAPSSMLNQMRREAVEQLDAWQGERRIAVVADAGLVVREEVGPRAGGGLGATAELHLLVRTAEQLEAAIARKPASITLDYLELYGLQPSVQRVKAGGIVVRVASPRVLKPGEQRIVHFLRKLDCAVVVRSAGLLQALLEGEHPELIGDFSLNAANAITARMFLEMGVNRLTPTHDLNAAQVAELAQAVGARNVEVIAYQHLPVFHTEHCVFCRFLSKGTSFEDCGHPCERHKVALRDEQGRAHPVMADVGCRNTVFGAEAQEASAHFEDWLEAGIVHYRLEFAHETGKEVEEVSRAFAEALGGEIGRKELIERLRRVCRQGTTEGSLFVPGNYLQLPVLQ